MTKTTLQVQSDRLAVVNKYVIHRMMLNMKKFENTQQMIDLMNTVIGMKSVRSTASSSGAPVTASDVNNLADTLGRTSL